MLPRTFLLAALIAIAGFGVAVGDEGVQDQAQTAGLVRRAVVVQLSTDSSLPSLTLTTPPPSLGLSPFYKRYIDAVGVPVVGSDEVSSDALFRAAETIRRLLARRPDILAALRASSQRVAVMSVNEVTTDIPEHADLYSAFPGTDWDVRARGLGATTARPVTSVGEENLLCHAKDRYRGESILVHELAHTILLLGVQQLPGGSSFRARLEESFSAATTRGTWSNTYAGSNVDEYWAEGVQDWFDTNIERIPGDGIHNAINTRVELVLFDPALADLIREVFGEEQPRIPCR